MHCAMKLDMSGAATILAAMAALRDLGCRAQVTGYLMCTDNMPSGTALRLGDVLTIRGGTTVEVVNTDAEGRLVMADGIVLSTEDQADAIVTIATLTGAAMRTFGTERAASWATTTTSSRQVEAAAEADRREGLAAAAGTGATGRQLDSTIADIKNLGGENAGTITAALFLDEFTAGIPFAHLDICGPMMVTADDSWRSMGATGFGARLLVAARLRLHAGPDGMSRRADGRRGTAAEGRTAHARPHRGGGQQGAAPGADVPVPDHRRDRALDQCSRSSTSR